MTTNHGHPNGDERNPSVLFDKSDLGARGILIFFLVLALFAVAAHFLVLGLYVGMTKVADKHEPDISPLATTTVTPRAGILTNTANVNIQTFPEPQLLIDDEAAMTKFLSQESAELAAPSRQDEQGNVHPSIDVAMREVVSRLPARGGTAALPNYPGVGREYSPPSAPDDSAAPQDPSAQSEGGNSGVAK
jgi:hypothetical protein